MKIFNNKLGFNMFIKFTYENKFPENEKKRILHNAVV